MLQVAKMTPRIKAQTGEEGNRGFSRQSSMVVLTFNVVIGAIKAFFCRIEDFWFTTLKLEDFRFASD